MPVLALFRILVLNSEVCHPRSAFKLYGEVNSATYKSIDIPPI